MRLARRWKQSDSAGDAIESRCGADGGKQIKKVSSAVEVEAPVLIHTSCTIR
jgi:hypothetical protein